MKGAAYYWWKVLQYDRFLEGKSLISSWPTMKRLLLKRFIPATCSTELLSNGEYMKTTSAITKRTEQIGKQRKSSLDEVAVKELSKELVEVKAADKHDGTIDLGVLGESEGIHQNTDIRTLKESKPSSFSIERAIEHTQQKGNFQGSEILNIVDKCGEEIVEHLIVDIEYSMKLSLETHSLKQVQNEAQNEADPYELQGKAVMDIQDLEVVEGLGERKDGKQAGVPVDALNRVTNLVADGYMNLAYLILSECIGSNNSKFVSLLFDPGGNPTFQKVGIYLFPNYGILLKKVVTNDRILLNIAHLKGESETNEPNGVVKKGNGDGLGCTANGDTLDVDESELFCVTKPRYFTKGIMIISCFYFGGLPGRLKANVEHSIKTYSPCGEDGNDLTESVEFAIILFDPGGRVSSRNFGGHLSFNYDVMFENIMNRFTKTSEDLADNNVVSGISPMTAHVRCGCCRKSIHPYSVTCGIELHVELGAAPLEKFAKLTKWILRWEDLNHAALLADERIWYKINLVLHIMNQTLGGWRSRTELSHGNFISDALISKDRDLAKKMHNVFLCILTKFHVSRLSNTVFADLQRGNIVVSMAKYNLGLISEIIDKYTVVYLWLVISTIFGWARNSLIQWQIGSEVVYLWPLLALLNDLPDFLTTTTSLEDELCEFGGWNDWNNSETTRKIMRVVLTVVAIASCSVHVVTLKLFHKLVNGLDPPMNTMMSLGGFKEDFYNRSWEHSEYQIDSFRSNRMAAFQGLLCLQTLQPTKP